MIFHACAFLTRLISAVFYYSIWKVSQDDFKDIDARGNLKANE